MVPKITYNVGDFFKIPVGNDMFGIGRILIAQGNGILAGFYDLLLKSAQDIDIETVAEQKYLLKLKCGNVGLAKKEWVIIGNIPLEREETLPLFWGQDLLTDSLYLREYITNENDLLGDAARFRDRPATEVEIQKFEAQPDGAFGWKAAELKLGAELRKNIKH